MLSDKVRSVNLLGIQERQTLLKDIYVSENEMNELASRVSAGYSKFDSSKVENILRAQNFVVTTRQAIIEQNVMITLSAQQYESVSGQYTFKVKKEATIGQLLENITKDYVLSLDDSLNEVFQFVYRKPDKKIKLEVAERYGKKVIQLKIEVKEGEVFYEESVEDDEGHSVSVVLGTVFLVYFIISNNLPRTLLFDESFSGLSQVTIDRFFPFLRMFAEKLNFSFLFISHDNLRIAQYMDRVYEVISGVFSLKG